MRFLRTLLLLLPLTVGATTYTEFYVQTTGSNLNSGHTTDDAATYSATGGNWTNNTSATTGTWFKTGESLAAVTNGAWAALYTDGTTTNAQYVGLITAVDDAADTITLSLQNYCGANPSTVVAGMSIKVGGAWKGMTTNTMANGGGFPFNFLSNTATNAQNVWPRCNIKSGTTYSVASAMTHANAGPIRFQGYTTSSGDGGKATIDGGTSGNYYIVLTASCTANDFADLIFANNGSASTATLGVQSTAARNCFLRCVFHDFGRDGLQFSAAGTAVECEAYACNKSNGANYSGFNIAGSGCVLIRCISHDHTGSAANGFFMQAGANLLSCIADSNGKAGFRVDGTAQHSFVGCVAYNNGSSGIDLVATTAQCDYLENCLIFKNAANGITSTGSFLRNGFMVDCAFGSGTQTNATGNIAANLGGINEIGTITYTADQTPWVDPANGDFRLASGATLVKAAGRGSFTQTAASYTGTVSYPDIGAAQLASTNAAAASGGSYTWSQ